LQTADALGAVQVQVGPEALALRDRFRQEEVLLHGPGIAGSRLEKHLDRLPDKTFSKLSNLRLANYLIHQRSHLFTFLL
jgi:hypothetical protein